MSKKIKKHQKAKKAAKKQEFSVSKIAEEVGLLGVTDSIIGANGELYTKEEHLKMMKSVFSTLSKNERELISKYEDSLINAIWNCISKVVVSNNDFETLSEEECEQLEKELLKNELLDILKNKEAVDLLLSMIFNPSKDDLTAKKQAKAAKKATKKMKTEKKATKKTDAEKKAELPKLKKRLEEYIEKKPKKYTKDIKPSLSEAIALNRVNDYSNALRKAFNI